MKRGVWQAGGFPAELPAMAVSETFMKPSSMLYRNFLAMQVEEMLRSHPCDGAVLMGGCDKTTPGVLMGALSMDIPIIFVPGEHRRLRTIVLSLSCVAHTHGAVLLQRAPCCGATRAATCSAPAPTSGRRSMSTAPGPSTREACAMSRRASHDPPVRNALPQNLAPVPAFTHSGSGLCRAQGTA